MTAGGRARRSLRPRSLAWQTVVLLAAEVLLYTAYARYDSRFHWATHFLVGLLAASAWQAVVLLVTRRPGRLPVLSVLGFHLWALWPDVAFRAGVPHDEWMDWVALGHVRSHLVPGGDDTWLVLALAGAGGYALLLRRWLAARSDEVRTG